MVALPVVVRGYGPDRAGILAVAWTLIGYFTLFDLGLARATTNVVTEILARDERGRLGPAVWTAWWLMGLFGSVGGATLWCLAELVVDHAVRVPAELRTEAISALHTLAFIVPLIVLAAAFRGVIEALHDFRALNLIRIPTGTLLFAAPAVTVHFSTDVSLALLVLFVVRIGAAAALAAVCIARLPELSSVCRPRRWPVRGLFRFGAWLTVSNVVSPIMASLDRLYVGAAVSLRAVAYYAIPLDTLLRSLLLPTAAAGVAFPLVARSRHGELQLAQPILLSTVKAVTIGLFPAMFTVVLFAPEILEGWLGREYADAATGSTRWIAGGVLLSAPAQVASAVVQGFGRTDVTAKLHVLELPGYLVAMVALTSTLGLTGTAMAWTIRVGFDSLVLCIYALRSLHVPRAVVVRGVLLVGALLLALLAAAMLDDVSTTKVVAVVVAAAMYPKLLWDRILNDRERRWLVRAIRAARVP